MWDKKEKQGSIKPINKHVSVLFTEVEERKSTGGIIIPKSVSDNQVTFKNEVIYKVEILKKAEDCDSMIPEKGFALMNQLSGFGIPTVEPGYVKIVHENSLLMLSETKEFNTQTIKPGQGRALVEVTSKVNKTESGILIPDGAQVSAKYDAATLGGKVISVADNIKSLKVGDTIRFDCYMGTEIFIEDKEYRMVLECEVIAKIEDDVQQ